jgi:hypothetical protein
MFIIKACQAVKIRQRVSLLGIEKLSKTKKRDSIIINRAVKIGHRLSLIFQRKIKAQFLLPGKSNFYYLACQKELISLKKEKESEPMDF